MPRPAERSRARGHGHLRGRGRAGAGAVARQRVPGALRSLLTPPRAATARGPRRRAVPDDGVRSTSPSRSLLVGITGFNIHRGVAGVGADGCPSPIAERLLEDHGRVVVVSAVNDNENLGAIFRTSAALGVGAVVLDDRCADPLYRRSVRRLARARPPPPPRADRSPPGRVRKDPGVRPPHRRPHPPRRQHPGRPGRRRRRLRRSLRARGRRRGPGLETDVIEAADVSVTIPMSPGVDSLNVATSLGVVAAFAAARRGWTG